MDSNNKSSEQVIAEMVEMGFEYSKILEAIKVVGPSIPSVVDHIFNNSSTEPSTSHTSTLPPRNGKKPLKKPAFSSSFQVPKSRTLDHYFQSTHKLTEKKNNPVIVDDDVEEHGESLPKIGVDFEPIIAQDMDTTTASDWEQKASILLQKHFGFSSLKSFQKEALSSWISHRDCLVLAATGSGFVL